MIKIMDNYRQLIKSILAKDSENVKKYLLLDDTSINHIDACNGPLHIACENQLEDMVDILLADPRLDYDKYFKNKAHNPLDRACWKGNVNIVKKFLAINPFWINLVNYDGLTPLHAAIKNENFTLFNILIKYKECKVDYTESFTQETPLLLAIKEGYFDVANILLEHGANINKVLSYRSNNILIEVINHEDSYKNQITRNYKKSIDFILSKDIDINYQNEWGDTALHRACVYGATQTVLELIKKGANLFIENNSNETPRDVVRNNDNLLVLIEKTQLENTVSMDNKVNKKMKI
jgi:ankyrin repeat protein